MVEQSKKTNVLIVEDDRILNRELAGILKYQGFCVQVAFDGQQGLNLIEKNKFMAILLDLKMPKVDGYEVLTQVKDKFSDIKVIVMTGSNLADIVLRGESSIELLDPDDKARCKILQRAEKIVTKPFEIEEIISILKNFSKDACSCC